MVICYVSESNFTFPPPALRTSQMTEAKFGTFVTGAIGGLDDDGVGGLVNVQLGMTAEVV